MIIIGIDPGVNTGIAILDESTSGITTQKCGFWGAISLIGKYHPDDVLIYCEAPYLNKPIFINKLDRQSVHISLKIAQNVGENKAIAKLIVEYCLLNNYRVFEIQPRRSKIVNLEYFKSLTGIEKRQSQHERDAAALIMHMQNYRERKVRP